MPVRTTCGRVAVGFRVLPYLQAGVTWKAQGCIAHPSHSRFVVPHCGKGILRSLVFTTKKEWVRAKEAGGNFRVFGFRVWGPGVVGPK